MQVTALAEALMEARRSDGALSLHDLQVRLTRAGLLEFARAVASLMLRPGLRSQESAVAADKTPWF